MAKRITSTVVNHRWLISAVSIVILSALFAGIVVSGEDVGNGETDRKTPHEIWILPVKDAIHPMISEFLTENIHKAEERRVHCLIIELDTPGGLMETTREIVKLEMNAGIPVIVYVAPRGARAASAGMFITIAAHVAVMAPATNIGAAHPVSMGGGDRPEPANQDIPPGPQEPDRQDIGWSPKIVQQSDIMEEKIMNDTLAWARTIAEKRGRNVSWVESAVVSSVSATEQEALKEGVIDLVCGSRSDLFIALNGRKIELANGEIATLETQNIQVVEKQMNFRQRLLSAIINPNIALYLLMFGIMGLVFEIMHPGVIFPGVFGAICLILGLFALHTLPINYAGLFLILLSFGFFAAEIKIPSYGILTIGGVVAFLLGASMLLDSDIPGLEISIAGLLPLLVSMVLITFFLVSLVLRSHRREVRTAEFGMVGLTGRVTQPLSPSGTIFVHGELWRARTKDAMMIPEGRMVKVIAMEGLSLIVEPILE